MDSRPVEAVRVGPGPARQVINMAISFLAPPRCGICGKPCGVTQPACGRCVAALARAPATQRQVADIDEIFSALSYQHEARRLITGLKFRRLVPLARVAAEVMAAHAPVRLLEAAIVPVPPSPARLRSRGLDPAEEIARALAALTGSRIQPCLGRAEAVRQVGRARRERLEDPPRFFGVAEPPASALLVDDVLTTGATLSACARALRSGGCTRVAGLTFACTERRQAVTPSSAASW